MDQDSKLIAEKYFHDVFNEDNKLTHDYSCTMAMVEGEPLAYFQKFINTIIDSKDIGKGGLEYETHCTILYGTHTSNVNDIKKIIAQSGINKIRFYLKGISSFPAGNDGVPLKIDVESKELKTLNKLLSQLPHTTDFPVYKPHITLGYLVPGQEKKYLNIKDPFKNAKFSTSIIQFSNQNGEKINFDLKDL